MRLKDRVALVTGAASGLGLAMVERFVAEGARVAVVDWNGDAAAGTAARFGAAAIAVRADVTKADEGQASVVRTVEAFGRLDILINNAGIVVDDPARKPSGQALSAWRETFDTNVFGLVETTNAFLPLLHASPSGRIVNVSSILGSISLQLDPGFFAYDYKLPAYNVSKAAVNAWTTQLAYELKDSRIKVNTIHPGYVRTDMNKIGGEQHGELEVADGARTSVRLALIDDDGPNGGFFYKDEVLPW